MNDDDSGIEAMLARYRPVGPPAELRARVLTTSQQSTHGQTLRALASGPARATLAKAGWLSMAAMLVLSLGLELAADRLRHETAAVLNRPGPRWTAEAEEAVELLNNQVSGRRYIAAALAVGGTRITGPPAEAVAVDLLRDIQ